MSNIFTDDIRKYVNELIEKEFGNATSNINSALKNVGTNSDSGSKKEREPRVLVEPEK